MTWRFGASLFFLAVLLLCVLSLAYRVIPEKHDISDSSDPSESSPGYIFDISGNVYRNSHYNRHDDMYN